MDLYKELQEAYAAGDRYQAEGNAEAVADIREYALKIEAAIKNQSTSSPEADTTSNPVAGVADSALGIVQGLANLVDRGGQVLEDTFGGKDYGIFYNEDDGLHFSRSPNDNPENTTIREAGEAVEKAREGIGYAPSTSVEDVKDNFWAAIPFAAERAVTSLPYLVNPAASGTSVLGSTVEQRLDNDRRNSATGEDFATAVVPAATEYAVNRYLRTGGSGLANSAKRIATGTAAGAGQGGIEDVATKAGTETPVTYASLENAAIEGAGSGLGVGVARQGLSALSRYNAPPKPVAEAAMPGMRAFLQRIQKETAASGLDLRDIDPTSLKGAKIALDNVHTQLRNEINEEARALKNRMTEADGRDLQARLDRATFQAISQKARNKVKNTVSPEDGEWLKRKFGNDANRLISLVDESNALATFARGGYRGGISGFAEKFGITPTTTSVADLTYLVTTGTVPITRAALLGADAIDKYVTGRRSRLDRAVRKLGSQVEPQQTPDTAVRTDAAITRGPAEPLPAEQRRPYYDETLRTAPAPDRVGGALQTIREHALRFNDMRGVRLKQDQQLTDDDIKNIIRKEAHTHPERYDAEFVDRLDEHLSADVIKLPKELLFRVTDLLASRIPSDPELSKKFSVPMAVRAESFSGDTPQGLTAAQRKVLEAMFSDGVTTFVMSGKIPGYAATAGGRLRKLAEEFSGAAKSDTKEDQKRKTAYERGAEANQRTYAEARKDINESDLPEKVKTDIKAELDNLESNFRDKPGSRQRIVNKLKRAHPDHATLIGKLLKPHVTIAKRNAMRKAAAEKAAASLK